MNKIGYYIALPLLVIAAALTYLAISGRAEAKRIEGEVVRFHVVAHSDEAEDQQLKLAVRDGIFDLVRQLFADCGNQREALDAAKENRHLLQAEAERILRAQGSDAKVAIEIGSRRFPSKDYGSFSFPAGKYQAVSIRIGEAEGENFWCVLYPALCLSPAVVEEEAADELTAVLGEESTRFLQREGVARQIKFAFAEWLGKIFQKFGKN